LMTFNKLPCGCVHLIEDSNPEVDFVGHFAFQVNLHKERYKKSAC